MTGAVSAGIAKIGAYGLPATDYADEQYNVGRRV